MSGSSTGLKALAALAALAVVVLFLDPEALPIAIAVELRTSLVTTAASPDDNTPPKSTLYITSILFELLVGVIDADKTEDHESELIKFVPLAVSVLVVLTTCNTAPG